jgi:hypothetical protein
MKRTLNRTQPEHEPTQAQRDKDAMRLELEPALLITYLKDIQQARRRSRQGERVIMQSEIANLLARYARTPLIMSDTEFDGCIRKMKKGTIVEAHWISNLDEVIDQAFARFEKAQEENT